MLNVIKEGLKENKVKLISILTHENNVKIIVIKLEN